MDDELQKAKDAAYHYLSFRARSIKEVRDKLEEKDYPEKIVAQVIAGLERQRSCGQRAHASVIHAAERTRVDAEGGRRSRPRPHKRQALSTSV